ncbi:MAG: ATP-binding protein [Chloroflexota bacterium]
MPNIFEQISLILTDPYGSLAYHLVISFIMVGVLYPALVFSSHEKPARTRMLLGIVGLLISQIVIFVFSALVLVGFSELKEALPVLDRAVIAIDLAIIIWLFSYTDNKNRRAGFILIGTIFFLMIAGAVTALFWYSSSEKTSFIQSEYGLYWDVGVILLAIFGQLIIARSPSKTRIWGRVMLLAIIIGEGINLLSAGSLPGEYSVILRLTYLISMPLLYGVIGELQSEITHTKMIVTKITERVPISEIEEEDPQKEEGKSSTIETGPLPEPSRGIDLHLFQNTMSLAASGSYQEISHLFTRYTGHALVADICVLLSPLDEDEQVHLISAYDLIVQESFSPFHFNHSIIPGYKEALESGEIIQVTDDTSSQISSFAHLIQVDRIHSMMVYPVIGSKGSAIAAVCLVSPYSKHVWNDKERDYLNRSSSAISAVLEQAFAAVPKTPTMQKLTDQLENSEIERKRLASEMEAISMEMAALSMLVEEKDEITSAEQTDLANLKTTLEVLETENISLKEIISEHTEQNNAYIQKITELEGQSAASPKELEDLGGKLQEALQRATNFENQLNQAKAQLEFLDQSNAQPESALPSEQAEVIASIAQELRQPMSSISGYTDLLISESVGILGALQKKFLERVKASTDRMNNLIGDLIQITTLDSGNLAFTPQAVEVIDIVDIAIENTSGQFREKNISLRVDISSGLPKMHTDKDAIQQILHHLLQNAGAATPEEGEIIIKVEPYSKTDNDIILLAVSDNGEGIPREDLPRVFSRLYRADNPLISGVGDTGVGLSIAKTLAEALGGRIWVESEQGVGSTFSVLLPITSETVSTAQG